MKRLNSNDSKDDPKSWGKEKLEAKIDKLQETFNKETRSKPCLQPTPKLRAMPDP